MTTHYPFVPPQLLRRLAEADDLPDWPAHTLQADEQLRQRRQSATPQPADGADADWTIYDAEGGTDLPGRPARKAGDPATGDEAVDDTADGIQKCLDYFAEVHQRDSFDGAGGAVSVTVHYGEDYVNAFWDGAQLVFGDGDGKVFAPFTGSLDVVAHEFAHAVVQHTANLVYQGQSGALNESVCDVFASCVRQRAEGQSAAEADWLIGRELFLPGVKARGLRDMANPGTAYDDPTLGKDPQVGHMDDFIDTAEDNGGVHLNSGIPNRAFQLAATAIGGNSWEGAGPIWYAALTSGAVGSTTDFAGFAQATVDAAGSHREAVDTAWRGVGVVPGESAPRPAPEAPTGAVTVRRTGGFTGIPEEGVIDLDGDDPRGVEARELLGRIDLAAAGSAREGAVPDGFTYVFTDPAGQQLVVPERSLTDELRQLAGLALRPDRR